MLGLEIRVGIVRMKTERKIDATPNQIIKGKNME
jgi:hypothetical protein